MEGEKNEELDIFKTFESSWYKFVLWVKANAHYLKNEEKESLLVRGIDRAPEFAFAMMLENVRHEPTGVFMPRLLCHRKAIDNRDKAYFFALAGETLDISDVDFPEEIVAKGFDFAEVFLDLILDLLEQ